MELGKSKANIAIAAFVLLALLMFQYFSVFFRDYTFDIQSARWTMSSTMSFENFASFQRGGCGKIECMQAKSVDNIWSFIKLRAADYCWNLLLWPTVVGIKIMIACGTTIHLRSIGSTALGAYIIHPYLPLFSVQAYNTILQLFGGGPFGTAAAKFMFFVAVIAYSLAIQYSCRSSCPCSCLCSCLCTCLCTSLCAWLCAYPLDPMPMRMPLPI